MTESSAENEFALIEKVFAEWEKRGGTFIFTDKDENGRPWPTREEIKWPPSWTA